MIGIARRIPARRAVDRPAAVDLVDIAIVELVGLLGGHLAAAILDDQRTLLDRLFSEKTKTCAGASDAVVTARKEFHDRGFTRQTVLVTSFTNVLKRFLCRSHLAQTPSRLPTAFHPRF